MYNFIEEIMRINKKLIAFCVLALVLLGVSSFSIKDKKELFTNEKTDLISHEIVQKGFEQTGQKNKHTRLFFNSDDIKRIKELYRQHDKLVRIAYDQIEKSANNILNQPIMHYKLDDAHLRISSIHGFASQVTALVMMYNLTGKKENREKL